MKSTLWLTALLATTALARADIVVVQKMESSFQNGTVTYKIKGDVARIDAPSPMGGNVTTIIDTKKGKMTSLMHAQKMAMEMDLNTMRQKAEAAMKGAGIDLSSAKPVATGQKQKIGDWDAEEYTLTAAGFTMHWWVAPNFPHGKLIKEEMSKISKAASGGALDPSSFDLPGVVVKSDADTPAGKVTTTLQSAQEEAVPASEFTVPEGYRSMPLPPALGGQK